MFPMFYGGALGTALQSSSLVAAPLAGALPSSMTFTRASGAGSYFSAVPAFGAGAFMARFTTGQTNTARFHYFAAAGRTMLLVEPAATNLLKDSIIVDVAPNSIPDGWTNAGGTAGTAYTTPLTGGPDDGPYFQLEDVAGTGRGVYHGALSLSATTSYAYSAFFRRTGTTGAGSMYAFDTNPGTAQFSIGTGTYDWTRLGTIATTVGAVVNGYMEAVGDIPGVVQITMPQIELSRGYPTSWVPTSGTALTRNAELCAVNSAVVSASHGTVAFSWCPLYANTEVTGTATLFAWSATSRIEFEGTGDTIRVVNNSNNRAASAALTFARESYHTIRVDYGAFGTNLYVDGTLTTDSNAWVAPTLACYLGSDAASANCESAGYGNFWAAA